MSYTDMSRFQPRITRVDRGTPKGPDPLTAVLKENAELKNKIAELETLISSMAPDAEEVEVVLEKPAKKAVKKKAPKKEAKDEVKVTDFIKDEKAAE